MQHPEGRLSKLSRRRILQTTTSLTALGIIGSGGSMAVAANPGTGQWVFDAGRGTITSSPTVDDGTVFVGSFDGNLYAVDAATGEQEWAFGTGSLIESSPTVVDRTVFVGSFDNNLYAVDATTGEQEWAFPTEDFIYSSPTVVDETVFVGSFDNNLYAVDATTGEQEWVFETEDSVRSSPTVVDGTVFVGSFDNNLYAVDAATGEQEWAFPTEDHVWSSPTVVDETVFVGSNDDNLYAVDATTGEQEWAFPSENRIESSPIVVDGTVFVGSFDDNLYAVDATTGEQEWAFGTGGVIASSPTVVDETVFVGSNDDNLYAVDATTGEQGWAFPTEGDVESSPIVVDGTVFVGNAENNLYAVDADVDNSTDGPTNSEQSTFTMDNLGSSAWAVSSADEEYVETSNGNNPTITLETGVRYTISNEGWSNHPLAFRDESGSRLLSQSSGGEFEDDADVNWSDSGNTLSFTLTDELANKINSYICTVHSNMVGQIETTESNTVSLNSVNIDPKEIPHPSGGKHTLSFTVQNLSADGERDDSADEFDIALPSNVEVSSVNIVRIRGLESTQPDPVPSNPIEFSVDPSAGDISSSPVEFEVELDLSVNE